jgi:hypothetical protein
MAIPEEPPEVCLREVNAVTAEAAIFERPGPTFLLATSQMCPHCKDFKPLITVAAELIDPAVVRFFWINHPRNDLPNFVPS